MNGIGVALVIIGAVIIAVPGFVFLLYAFFASIAESARDQRWGELIGLLVAFVAFTLLLSGAALMAISRMG